MLRKLLLMLFTGLLIQQVSARKLKGYFVTQSNDTVWVTFKVKIKLISQEPDYERLQWKVKYLDSYNKKHSLTPLMANEIVFDYEGELSRMLSAPNNLGLNGPFFANTKKVFLRVIKDGKLKLFRYYKTYHSGGGFNAAGSMSPGYSGTSAKYILQKEYGLLFKTGLLSFKKDMLVFLYDCPDVAEKIEDNTYHRNDMEQIVDDYNWRCK